MELPRRARAILCASIVLGATSALVYELALGTVASYVLGSTVTEFAIVLGVYLSAMGVGALLSRRVERRLAEGFIVVETAVALVGGTSVLVLLSLARSTPAFGSVLYAEATLTGVLAGLELPLILRLLKALPDASAARVAVSDALTFDYAGSLVASLAFPLVLMPWLGVARGAVMAGLLNALAAFGMGRLLLRARGALLVAPALAGALLTVVLAFAPSP